MNKHLSQTDYDIAIVGAGLSGSLLAHAVLKLSPSLKIVLLDDNAEQLDKGCHPGFDARSVALSAGSYHILDELGLWSELQEKAQPIEDIHISDRGHFGALDLPKCAKDKAFGYVVELQDAGVVISKKLTEYKQLTRRYNTRLLSIEKQANQVLCKLESGQCFSAKLCVAADGTNSMTRELLNIVSETTDYACTAVIANLNTTKPHLNKAYERFTEYGPIALLPLTSNRYSLVWSIKNNEAERLAGLSEDAFLRELQQAFGFRAGIFQAVGKRDFYPLQLVTTAKPITHRALCIGNAAHCLHPVMGQGFNLGLRDLFVLAQVISEVENQSSIGDYQMLNRYWLARQKDHQKTIQMTDSMVRIFSHNNWPFVLGRNIALQMMNCFPSLTQPIVEQAKGQFNLHGNNNDPIL